MSSELTIKQVMDYILAAPNDQEFVNRVCQHLHGHHTDMDRQREIHARVSYRLAALLRAGIQPNYNPCNGQPPVVE